MNRRLEAHGACLLPGAMHPWMLPATEAQRWPHGQTELYEAFADMFDCQTHGWANLQSMHINLPFAGDTELARLHAAVRLVLPLIPALAASSPVADGMQTGFADYRLEVYRTNADAYPEITGGVIPEMIESRAAYEQKILQPMYRSIASVDSRGILQEEWLNSRGAIARFDRSAIEIRVTDTQECIAADLAVAGAIVSAVHYVYRRGVTATALAFDTSALQSMLLAAIRDGDRVSITDPVYLALVGFSGCACSAAELWRHWIGQQLPPQLKMGNRSREILDRILTNGTLSRRISAAIGPSPSRDKLREVYLQLCECLENDCLFMASDEDAPGDLARMTEHAVVGPERRSMA